MDLLLRGATVLTLDPERRVLEEGYVAVRDGRIAAIGSVGTGEPPAAETIELPGRILLPGLVQSHVHLCQTLFRNLAEGLPLLEWLRARIWPLEAAHDAESLRASALLGIAELLRGGTTTALDMGTVRHTEQIFAAAEETGFRLTGGKCHMDAGEALPPEFREETGASLQEGAALCGRWHGAGAGRLRYAFAPRFALACSDELLEGAAALAREHGALLHTHASENAEECAAVRRRFGAPNVQALHRFGISGADTVLAHCVHLEAGEPERLQETATSVAHCPTANLKLASGVAPVPALLARGVNVGLGADGAPCNNTLDAFHEMRLAALIQKPLHGAAAMPADQVLEMATLGGARALGLEAEIGSLEPGKQADLVALDLRRPHALPAGPDPCARVVHCARADDVEAVWIGGRRLVWRGACASLDEERVLAEGAHHAARLAKRVL